MKTNKKNIAIAMASAALFLGTSENDTAARAALADMAEEYAINDIVAMDAPFDMSALMQEVRLTATKRVKRHRTVKLFNISNN